jgi:hypothetical protein
MISFMTISTRPAQIYCDSDMGCEVFVGKFAAMAKMTKISCWQ